MSIVVVGLSHKTAPIDLLERLAIIEDELPKALHQLNGYARVLDGAVLSTCNRTEAYATVSGFHGGAQDLRNFLGEFCHVAPEDFSDHLYTLHDEAAVRHLFRVAAGIDSMIVGESEILGQVRRAFNRAREEKCVHGVLSSIFQRALRVGKRARTETQIGRNPVSISSAAVELARRAFDSKTLTDKHVALIGAGKMGRLAARALVQAGAKEITIVNRTQERAEELAALVDAIQRPWSELESVLRDADIAICSTTAPSSVIDRSLVERARASVTKPLFIVDIAVPRDVDANVGTLSGVVLRDIDDLRGVVDTNIDTRLGEALAVERIIEQELTRFFEWHRASDAEPVVSALLERGETIRAGETARLVDQWDDLSDAQRALVDETTKRIVAGLLDDPVQKAREADGFKQRHVYLAALRELFELGDDPNL